MHLPLFSWFCTFFVFLVFLFLFLSRNCCTLRSTAGLRLVGATAFSSIRRYQRALGHLSHLRGAVGRRLLSGSLADTIFDIHHLNLLVGHLGENLGGLDAGHLVDVALGKDQVDFFQAAVGRLRVEDVDDRNEDGVQRREEQIGTPVDTVNHDRGDHNDGEVEQPVAASRHGIGLRTGLGGRQFRRVQPGQRQPSGAKTGHVQEEPEDGAFLDGVAALGNQASKGNHHCNGLNKRTVEEQLAAANLLDEEPRESCKDGIDDHVDTSDQQRKVVLLTHRLLEQDRQIVDNRVASTQLLEDLRRRANEHAAEMLRRTAGEQVTELGILVCRAGPVLY